MVRVGVVSQIDYATGRIKVGFRDRDNPESNWMGLPAHEYDPPKVGDLVAVALDYGNYGEGVCIGTYYSEANIPTPAGENICYKRFGEDLIFKYDKKEKILVITAKAIQLVAETLEFTGELAMTGEVKVVGNLSIAGDLDVSGAITAATVNGK